jgi:hypothetical protein
MVQVPPRPTYLGLTGKRQYATFTKGFWIKRKYLGLQVEYKYSIQVPNDRISEGSTKTVEETKWRWATAADLTALHAMKAPQLFCGSGKDFSLYKPTPEPGPELGLTHNISHESVMIQGEERLALRVEVYDEGSSAWWRYGATEDLTALLGGKF